MTQKDYILRQVEAFGQALARISGLRLQSRVQAALIQLDELIDRFVGLRLKGLRSLTYEELRSLVAPEGKLDLERSLMLVDALLEEAALEEAQGRADLSAATSAFAVRLAVEAESVQGPGAISARSEPLGLARRRVGSESVDRETQDALVRFDCIAAETGGAAT